MWDFPLYDANMVLLPLVNIEASLGHGKAEYSQAGRNLTGRPQPCGHTQINRNGLI